MSDERTDRLHLVPDRLEAGVSGLARMREWDAVRLIEVPELENDRLSAFSFRLGFGHAIELASDGPASLPAGVVQRFQKTLRHIKPPAIGRATRRSAVIWSVAARRLGQTAIKLDAPATVCELSVALPPAGEAVRLVDGEEPAELSPELAGLLDELERLGRERFDRFAVSAERLDERFFGVQIDAL
ncbi:MAG: hypothetical protein OXG37_12260 [Actinomycetia bacterium]|nr:hypothetical protein [Actinomycetes bacterium]